MRGDVLAGVLSTEVLLAGAVLAGAVLAGAVLAAAMLVLLAVLAVTVLAVAVLGGGAGCGDVLAGVLSVAALAGAVLAGSVLAAAVLVVLAVLARRCWRWRCWRCCGGVLGGDQMRGGGCMWGTPKLMWGVTRRPPSFGKQPALVPAKNSELSTSPHVRCCSFSAPRKGSFGVV